ncbi:glycosyl hydrolase 53 family protein [Streptomyces sp. ACA25]|uniref:glycosyl hydrolase 53 family protein n=1 Tax=Streptomyces sp. ACA25 TaxID=3022596 RepID=UPI003FA6D831
MDARLRRVVVSVPGGRGLGIFYWEPATPGNGRDPADPSSGNARVNQAFFDHDDRVLPAARW